MGNNSFAYLVPCSLGPVTHLVILLADRGEPILSPIPDTMNIEFYSPIAAINENRNQLHLADPAISPSASRAFAREKKINRFYKQISPHVHSVTTHDNETKR